MAKLSSERNVATAVDADPAVERAARSSGSSSGSAPGCSGIVVLPTPTEREKSQMNLQRYLPHFPAADEVIIFDRSLVQPGRRGAGDGLLHPRADHPS